VAAGETVTKIKKVGKGKAATAITVTRTEPTTVKVVDETVPESFAPGLWPEVEGKIVTKALAGITLVRYPSGYTALRIKGPVGFNDSRKVTIGKALYKSDLIHLANLLLEEAEKCQTYEEAHGLEATPF
jgi:hypothetical protein